MKRIKVIDSHTGGEPTRVILSGGPDLGVGSIGARFKIFRGSCDRFRSAIINEPRGYDALVGALLVEPTDHSCVTGVIFFNNVGYLGMCGHGMIGLIATLAHLGRIQPGAHRIETCVGVVTATLHRDGQVSVTNVASYRKKKGVRVKVPGLGVIPGDVAWGGNWFFLVEDHGQSLELTNVEHLTAFAWKLRKAINAQGFPEVDHVEFFGRPKNAKANARNFVLCPGKAYDRSPCGTGTSAKLACLAADGKLREGETWVQESITGSLFTASYRRSGNQVLPTITGAAFVNAEATLILDDDDPFCWGIDSPGSAGAQGAVSARTSLRSAPRRRSLGKVLRAPRNNRRK